jgi:aspartokinase/homoserine dehydrogenase 1
MARTSRPVSPSPRPRATPSTLHVWKFGGASLADGAAVRTAADRIATHRGPLVVVASALAGITDLLLDGADHAVNGRAKEAAAAGATFRARHQRVAQAAIARGPALRETLRVIDASAREYEDICAAIGILRHLSPRTRDLLVSRGERLSAAMLAAAIGHAGRRAVYVDALEVVATDGTFGGASPQIAESTRRARRVLGPHVRAGRVPIVPGFIGRAPDGGVATLGRGGSDLTATLMARAMGARVVSLWKDVPGILTSDPRLVPDARLIPQLHHQEAAEVAHYGAKVLHPRALIPIAGTRVTLEVRSFAEPARPGTTVSGRLVSPQYPVKAVAVLPRQAVVTVAGKGMVGVHGIAARTFAAVDAEQLSVSTIFQASSESSIGFTLPEGEADRAVEGLRRAFRDELANGLIDGVTATPGM